MKKIKIISTLFMFGVLFIFTNYVSADELPNPPTISNPISGVFINNDPFVISGTCGVPDTLGSVMVGFENLGNVLASGADCDANGNFTLEISSATIGPITHYPIRIMAYYNGSNYGGAQNQSSQVELTDPNLLVPSITGMSPEKINSGHHIAMTDQITFSGTGTSGDNIVLKYHPTLCVDVCSDSVFGSTIVTSDGTWSFKNTNLNFTNGNYIIYAINTNNQNSNNFDFTINKPAIFSLSPDSGSSNTDHITNSSNLSFYGTAEPNTEIRFNIDYLFGYACMAQSDDSGNWACDGASEIKNIPDGTYNATAVAVVNGVGIEFSDPFAFTVDTAAPGPLALENISSGPYSGPFPIEVKGSCEPGASIIVKYSSLNSGATCPDDGKFSAFLSKGDLVVDEKYVINITAEDLPLDFGLIQSDLAGNESWGSLKLTKPEPKQEPEPKHYSSGGTGFMPQPGDLYSTTINEHKSVFINKVDEIKIDEIKETKKVDTGKVKIKTNKKENIEVPINLSANVKKENFFKSFLTMILDRGMSLFAFK